MNRRYLWLICLAMTSIGCSTMFPKKPAPRPVSTAQKVDVDRVLTAINQNSKKVDSLECQKVYIDGKSQGQPYSLTAHMAFQQPHHFRLVGSFAGTSQVDLGSNEEEIWFWFARAEPPALYFCKRDELPYVNIAIPFQPDWLVEVLGAGHFDPRHYRVGQYSTPELFTLESQERTPNGQTVIKRLVMDRSTERIRGFELFDASQRPARKIAEAWVHDYLENPATGAYVHRRVELRWPDADTKLTIALVDRKTDMNHITSQQAVTMFRRDNFDPSLPRIDLARMDRDERTYASERASANYRGDQSRSGTGDPAIRRASGAESLRVPNPSSSIIPTDVR